MEESWKYRPLEELKVLSSQAVPEKSAVYSTQVFTSGMGTRSKEPQAKSRRKTRVRSFSVTSFIFTFT